MKKRAQITLFILIAIVLIGTIILVAKFKGSNNTNTQIIECTTDEDCVPATCCHPDTCVPVGKQPDCSEAFCTQACEPETLDCGQGSCVCIQGKCKTTLQ